jgi:hypothetical protein
MTESRRKRYDGHIAYVRQIMKEKKLFERPRYGWQKLIELVSKKEGDRECTGLVWPRTEAGDGLFSNGKTYLAHQVGNFIGVGFAILNLDDP